MAPAPAFPSNKMRSLNYLAKNRMVTHPPFPSSNSSTNTPLRLDPRKTPNRLQRRLGPSRLRRTLHPARPCARSTTTSSSSRSPNSSRAPTTSNSQRWQFKSLSNALPRAGGWGGRAKRGREAYAPLTPKASRRKRQETGAPARSEG